MSDAAGSPGMALTHANSVVFVGGDFSPAMFDERALFGGRLGPDQVRIGPIGQFRYADDTYRVEISPNRIDLAHKGAEIMPDELIAAARAVAAEIEPARRAVGVSGVGMNCDTVIDRRVVGARGVDFCSRLTQSGLSELVDSSEIAVSVQTRFPSGVLHYTVRIEPHGPSAGDDLFLAVNGHRDISMEDKIGEKLDRAPAFRAYVSSLHERVARNGKER